MSETKIIFESSEVNITPENEETASGVLPHLNEPAWDEWSNAEDVEEAGFVAAAKRSRAKFINENSD